MSAQPLLFPNREPEPDPEELEPELPALALVEAPAAIVGPMPARLYQTTCERFLMRCRRGYRLTTADPPWSFNNSSGGASFRSAAGRYRCERSIAPILNVLDMAYDAAFEDSYLICWIPIALVFPVAVAWASYGVRWEPLSGGAWTKPGRLGVGFHLRGNAEDWFLFRKGSPHPRLRNVRNGYHEPIGAHSEKPVGLQRLLFDGLAPHGCTVLDLYAGRASAGRAALLAGRGYDGVEVSGGRVLKAVQACRALEVVPERQRAQRAA